MPRWDVIVVGGGPAGLAAAHAAAGAGATTLVLERSAHPRYKTCGGGLIGTTLASIPTGVRPPVRDHIDRVVFTLDGGRELVRDTDAGPVVAMVARSEFDLALRDGALAAGAEVREHSTVRELTEDSDGVQVAVGRDRLRAAVVIGADGSSGITSRYVGVRHGQVDLGLELELPASEALAQEWRGRLLIDWGPLPGSYAWVFPKRDRLTVGVIATRGQGEATKRYLRDFVGRLGLSGLEPEHDSGHLTRCRTVDSPLRRGRVLVAGDAAGLLEPWTREGISYALRSGVLAGTTAADVARSGSASGLDAYQDGVFRLLEPEMAAGRRLYAAYSRHPRAFHTMIGTGPGWRMFSRFCRGEMGFADVAARPAARAALAVFARV